MASTVSRRPPSSRRTAPAIRASAPRSPARPRAAGSHPRGVGGVGSPAPAPRRRLGGLTTSPVPRGPPGRRAVWRRGAAAARKQAREPRARAPRSFFLVRSICAAAPISRPRILSARRASRPSTTPRGAGPIAARRLSGIAARKQRRLRKVPEAGPHPRRAPKSRNRDLPVPHRWHRRGRAHARAAPRRAGAKKSSAKSKIKIKIGVVRHDSRTRTKRRRGGGGWPYQSACARARAWRGERARACALMGAHPSEPSRGRASAVRRRRRRERGEGAPASQRARDPHACQPCRTGSSSVRCARAPGCRRSCARRERGREGERAAAAAGVRPAAAVRRFAEVSCALRAQPPPTRARVGC